MLLTISLFTFSLSLEADEALPTGLYTLTEIKVVPMNRSVVDGKVNDHKSNALTHWVRFDVHPKFKVLDGTKAKPFKIINPPEAAKCSVTVDKPIRFKGKEVPAGTNLLKHQRFDGSFFNISMALPNPFAISSIRIRDDFTFPPDTYTLRFQWETSDGVKFTDTVTVRIALEPKMENKSQ